MANFYLTDYTTSVEHLNEAFESIIQGSHFDCKAANENFSSKGEGIITDNFFIGNFITKYVESIHIKNFNHFVITLPKTGQFTARIPNTAVLNKAGETGALICSVDEVLYDDPTELVNDHIIIIDRNDLMALLEKKYGMTHINDGIRELDLKNEKVKVLFNYIGSMLNIMNAYSSIQQSLVAKMNIKEITLLMTSDFIGDVFNKKNLLDNSPNKKLVIKAEEVIEGYFNTITTIQEIADKVFTSPRNLQKAFKKYRDYSPMQFLKHRKLIHANEMFRDPYYTSSIKHMAIHVGIYDINRFSRYYFEEFGEYPTDTLKSSKQSSSS
jgi:AraC-like DNA-binding protein